MWVDQHVFDPRVPDDQALIDQTGLVVPSEPRSVALVRRYAVDVCTALGWGGSADTVELLASEVATNAVLHARSAHLRVCVLDHGLRLRVEVSDDSTVFPVPRSARPDDENGRGLALVKALAVAWGADARPDGKTAWFEIGV